MMTLILADELIQNMLKLLIINNKIDKVIESLHMKSDTFWSNLLNFEFC